jgi:hypothetical protein
VATGWLLIRIIKELHPQWFAWATYPTHVNPTGKQHLDLLAGIPGIEQFFETPMSGFIEQMKMRLSTSDWMSRVAPFLLYA